MGASNIAAAYRAYAGRVGARSMQVLVYMCLVSRDSDEQPWYGEGHAALARHALGRPEPVSGADLKAVQRAVSPLKAVGAVSVDRRPTNNRADGPETTRYRLHLNADGGQKTSSDTPVDNSSEEGPRWTKTVRDGGRKPSSRWTKIVLSVDENRPPKEQEEYEEREEEEVVASPTQVQTARENFESTANSSVKCLHGLPADIRADGEPSCALCRRAAREAS